MSKVKVDEIESIDGTRLVATKDMWKTLPTAWVRFVGDGGIVINSSYNVTSVVRDSEGTYSITFQTPMDNADYSTHVSSGVDSGSNPAGSSTALGIHGLSKVTVYTNNASLPGASDRTIVSVLVLGGKN